MMGQRRKAGNRNLGIKGPGRNGPGPPNSAKAPAATLQSAIESANPCWLHLQRIYSKNSIVESVIFIGAHDASPAARLVTSFSLQ
jgi:hypothetical protein